MSVQYITKKEKREKKQESYNNENKWTQLSLNSKISKIEEKLLINTPEVYKELSKEFLKK